MKLQLANLRFGSSCTGVCSVASADKEHPNKLPFNGTLLLVDQASDKPPHGAEGHRIYVPKSVAQRRLSTLINTGVNYTSDLDSHAPQKKVGVITGARIDGKKVIVNGFFWKRDFPKVESDMSQGKLGMSMELADVTLRSKADPIWYLEDFHFSGATILYKAAAAYTQTSLSASAISRLGEEWGRLVKAEISKTALAAMAANVRNLEGGRMKKKEKSLSASSNGQGELLVKAIADGVGPAIQAAITDSLTPFVTVLKKQQASIARIAASVEETKALSLESARDEEEEVVEEEETEDKNKKKIHAGKHEEEEEMDAHHEEEEDMDAAGHKKSEDDDEEDSEDEDLDAEMEHLEEDHADEEPGEVNEDAANRGDKTTRTGKIGKDKAMKELVKSSSIRASSVIRELYASHRALRRKYKTLRASANTKIESLQNKIEAMEAQMEQYASREDRKTVSAELTNFLAKNNVDVRELRAEGRKLATEEVDQIFANAPVQLDPTTRMWFKNQLLSADLMEQGEVHRYAQ